MKTIEVSDEDYDFLKECVNLLHTQDTRATRSPIYTIHKQEKVYGIDEEYTSKFVYVWEDSEFESLEDVFTFLLENGYEDYLIEFYNEYNDDGDELSLNDDGEINEEDVGKIKELFIDECTGVTEDWLADKFDIRQVGVRLEEVQETDGTCFSFFEQDAFDHLKLNGHNIRGEQIHTYADSLYRSPLMEKLLEFLNKLELE